MRARSQHREVFVGALILAGLLGWATVLLGPAFLMPLASHLAVAFASSFAAGFVSRRTMGALTVSETAIMGAVATTIVNGMLHVRFGRGVDLELLSVVAASTAGASLGGYAVRRPGASGKGWRAVATGAASIGMATLLIGVAFASGQWDMGGDAMFVGVPLGGILAAAWIDQADEQDVAMGLGVATAVLLLADGLNVGLAIAGGAFGGITGVIAGTIGRKLRQRGERAAIATPVTVAEARVEAER